MGKQDLRRSAKYKPNIWGHGFLQSLCPKDEEIRQYELQGEKLKEEVKLIFGEMVKDDLVGKVELIDSVTKLGLGSFFEEEIKEGLDNVMSSSSNIGKPSNSHTKHSLHFCALSFRLLRQHGYHVSQDMFREFMDKPTRSFVESKCCGDMLGLVELYEASHLGLEKEDIMKEANRFSARVLKSSYQSLRLHLDDDMAEHVAHALELPIHWRVRWFDVKWQIKAHERKKKTSVNETLVALAKVNFNVVQSSLQKDLKEISRWWKDLGLIERLDFTRDRVVESFLCTVGLAIEPEYSSFRKRLTKVIIMILIFDDIYDVYGTTEQLQGFTTAIDKWDAREVEKLPEPMKLCFHALTDLIEDISIEIQNEQGWDQVQPHLERVWGDFCKAMLVEAKWCRRRQTPSLKEYLTNGGVSSSGRLISVHSFCSLLKNSEVTVEMKSLFEKNRHLIHNVCLIIRLCNDVGTSKEEQERGEAASSIACYMREANTSEEKAKDHIKGLIAKVWKKINEQCFRRQPPASIRLFVDVNTNMARVAHNLYQHGDGFGEQDHKRHKTQILSLLAHPLKL